MSSEGVESIALSPVVVQEMGLEELIRLMLGLTGKDSARIRELLLRGTLVSGASRFRWQGFDADVPAIDSYLRRYPDADATLTFNAEQCFQAVLRGPSKPLTIEREAGLKRRMFRNQSFWEVLMSLAVGPRYLDYSYRERADIFRVALTPESQRKLQDAAKLLAYSSFEKQIATGAIQQVDLYVRR